jgi:hypothetical protein
MTFEDWLDEFTAKLKDAADRAKDPVAKSILMAKWGNSNFILERFREKKDA